MRVTISLPAIDRAKKDIAARPPAACVEAADLFSGVQERVLRHIFRQGAIPHDQEGRLNCLHLVFQHQRI